ncbi:HindIII family type II restriction endonuclease [Thomasclavelia cocleata]|uniref:HindIII family type II restriction endonuclease n=1 Tax=Thomasclavelia cocleata TaxID=69824 RepID=UPI00258B393C|nr:HindIII family type II restriction endonuclease [Thomasclavelia cocleata]
MSVYNDFVSRIIELSKSKIKFKESSEELIEYVDKLKRDEFISIIEQIGTIPEVIIPSSTAEKCYSKASDIILARCFRELGLSAKVSEERGDAADIIAKSEHGYSLVADAKTFRLSRTAKNQKDFKISTLSKWRGMENDYAVLVAPYFQYPSKQSQIYSSSLDTKVCLLSWEHILFLLNNNIEENINLSLEQIWNAPERIVRDSRIAYADRKNNLFPYINKMVCERASLSIDDFEAQLQICKSNIKKRSITEIKEIENEIHKTEILSREEAIQELIKSKKLYEKLNAIKSYMRSLNGVI